MSAALADQRVCASGVATRLLKQTALFYLCIAYVPLQYALNGAKPLRQCLFRPSCSRLSRDGCPVSSLSTLCCRQSDIDMWAALEAVQMKEYVQGMPQGLDATVSEGGGNLSVSSNEGEVWL